MRHASFNSIVTSPRRAARRAAAGAPAPRRAMQALRLLALAAACSTAYAAAGAINTAATMTCCDCAGTPMIDRETNRSLGPWHWCPWGAGQYRGCHPPRPAGIPDPAYTCNGSTKGGPMVASTSHCPEPCPCSAPGNPGQPCIPPPPSPPRPPTPPAPKPSANKKRGVCLAPHGNSTHCDDIRALSEVVTWYTNWGEADTLFQNLDCAAEGFPGGLPSVPTMEYVPQLWGAGGLRNPALLNNSMLSKSKYIMAFNEPDMFGQSWIHPSDAAALWPNMTVLAKQYHLKLIGPCVSNAGGAKWWLDDFDKNCTARYGAKCQFDYPCTHAYYFPQPCEGLPDWACADAMMPMIKSISERSMYTLPKSLLP